MKNKHLHLALTVLMTVAMAFSADAQLLWRVDFPSSEKPSYLFGTMHFAPVSVADSTQGFSEAFNGVDAVIGEITPAEMQSAASNPVAIMMKAQAPADSTLQALLDKETFARLDSIMMKDVGMGAMSLNTLKPMMTYMTLESIQAMKYMGDANPLTLVDMALLGRADSLGKSVEGLETAEMQLDMLMGINLSTQAAMLAQMVNNYGADADKAMHNLVDAYMTHDLDAICELTLNDESSAGGTEFQHNLIVNRNNKWIKVLAPRMKAGPVMVVVGAGHLCSSRGLIELLRKEGAKVTPVDTPVVTF